MFKIERLDMHSYDGKVYSYTFKEGINYFVGKNNSGKTEFYKFIDYMFGSSDKIKNSHWYKDTLNKAVMVFTYNSLSYRITRILNNDMCYFAYLDEEDAEAINVDEYKDRLQAIFTLDVDELKKMREITEEAMTYRTFTLFSFLGELRQGNLVDFFDKCSDIRYSTKIGSILNLIFNKNVERIYFLKNEIPKLQKELDSIEKRHDSDSTIIHKVNINLQKLNIKEFFDGKNGKAILSKLKALEDLMDVTPMVTKNISELEVIYSNICEQIKVYEKYKNDLSVQQAENENREKMLNTFKEIITDNQSYQYLVDPLIELTEEIKNSISFSKYVIKDEVIGKLKRQKEDVRKEILKAGFQVAQLGYDEKMKALAIAEDGITSFSGDVSSDDIKELRDKIQKYRDELKRLQRLDDVKKIEEISQKITALYNSAQDKADFIKDDYRETNDKFHINYIKSRNALQTMTTNEDKGEIIYATGSNARHTLIQLCGYLVFMAMLIEEKKYPIIPMIIIDHISKPFDEKNVASIGTVIHEAYKEIGEENMQIFMFDDKESEKLDLTPNHKENLVNETKTGFNPFFNAK